MFWLADEQPYVGGVKNGHAHAMTPGVPQHETNCLSVQSYHGRPPATTPRPLPSHQLGKSYPRSSLSSYLLT